MIAIILMNYFNNTKDWLLKFIRDQTMKYKLIFSKIAFSSFSFNFKLFIKTPNEPNLSLMSSSYDCSHVLPTITAKPFHYNHDLSLTEYKVRRGNAEYSIYLIAI